jgi:glycerol-3-phosphate acyltransferase PlsY
MAYLLGSIPTAYLIGKWLKGIDLRKYGSGTVSGSMVWEHVGKLAVFPVGIVDLFKGIIPVWISLTCGLSESSAAVAGLFAVLGHNWTIFLKFHGGRGLSPFLGILIVLFPYGFVFMAVMLGIGYLLHDSAPFALAALGMLAIVSHLLRGPSAILILSIGMLAITIGKRLEANRRPLPEEKQERNRVLFLRFFFDRDIKDHKAWLRRMPPEENHEKG